MDSLSRIRKFRYPIAVSNRLNWHFAQTTYGKGNIWILGYPKSGTTWVAQLVSTATGVPFPRLSVLPSTFTSVLHGHQVPLTTTPKCLYVVRDGREALASLFYHRSQRAGEILDPKRFGIFLADELETPSGTHGYNWAEHVAAGVTTSIQRPDSVALVRYDQLRTDPFETLRSALTTLKLRHTEASLSGAIDLFDLRNLRSVGEDARFLSSGQRPTWADLATDNDRKLFDRVCGSALARLDIPPTGRDPLA